MSEYRSDRGGKGTLSKPRFTRLTRALADFARLVEIFDTQGVSFVSVTQQFNTTSSMGRLTLNVLLSFAQFEREVTGERIRDKIAASKKKGMWMGGNVPLGYDASEGRLVVNPVEAETVRRIFALYRELGSVRWVKEEADRLGLQTKRRVTANGTERGGKPFASGHLYGLLSNPIYACRPLVLGHIKMAIERGLLGERTQTVRLVLRGDDHGRGVGVQQLRLQQHIAAKAQTPDQIAVLQPPDTDLEVGLQVILLPNHFGMPPSKLVEQLAHWREQAARVLDLEQIGFETLNTRFLSINVNLTRVCDPQLAAIWC